MKEKGTLVPTAITSERLEKAVMDMIAASDELYRVARVISDRHWAAVEGEADEVGAFFRYGVRVKRRVYGVSIEWMKGVPTGTGQTRRVLFMTLPRGRGLSYRRSTFGWAKPWEVTQIMKAEADFAKVRNASNRLADAGLRMRWMKKVLERGDDIDSKRLRGVLARVEESCSAVRELARIDLAVEKNGVT